jgi:Rrf2 family transcriptional regulator, iron-sulfur cluster assembly transcription factor
MRISSKSKIATDVLVDLAAHAQKDTVVSMMDLSRRQKISLSYLEQILGVMKIAGLIESYRGPGGGYTLAKSAESITVGQVVALFDGVQSSEKKLGMELWDSLRLHMQDQMGKISLSMLVKEFPVDVSVVNKEPKTIKKSLARARTSLKKLKISKVIVSQKKEAKLGPNSVFAFGRYLNSI